MLLPICYKKHPLNAPECQWVTLHWYYNERETMENEKTITIPVSSLEWLAEQNENDIAMYRESGLEGMASWCEGRAHGYRTLLTVYGS